MLKDRFDRHVIADATAEEYDRELFPNVHRATPIYVTQEAGDAIFVPSGWYHQVTNLEGTISINHNWFNGFNVLEVWTFFQFEYAAVEKELEHLQEIGLTGWDFKTQCQLVMAANTGIDYAEFRELLYAKARELLAIVADDLKTPEIQRAHDHLVIVRYQLKPCCCLNE